MNHDLFVAAVRNAKDAEDSLVLTEEEFKGVLEDGMMYHQYEDVSVLFYGDFLGTKVCMTVDGDETYKFETYEEYRKLVDSWD